MTDLRDHRRGLNFVGRHFILADCVRKFIFPSQDQIVTSRNIVPARKKCQPTAGTMLTMSVNHFWQSIIVILFKGNFAKPVYLRRAVWRVR